MKGRPAMQHPAAGPLSPIQKGADAIAPEVDRVLRLRAQNIAERSGLPEARVYEVLKNTVREIDRDHPRWREDLDFQRRIDSRLYHDPDLGQALEYLLPHDALHLFENTNLRLLAQRVQVTGLFLKRDTPLYTHRELADHIQSFIRHLEKNKRSLLRTGLSETCFIACPLLEKNLDKLYYTRLPVVFLAQEWSLTGEGTTKQVMPGSDGINDYSGSSRSVIPIEGGHRFRGKAVRVPGDSGHGSEGRRSPAGAT